MTRMLLVLALLGAPAERSVVASHLIRVYDGDTFYVGAETIRLRGIDTPEIGEPRAAAAARRLLQLLSIGPVLIARRGEDVYGRTLADVFVRGRNVARILRAEGYAKPRRCGPGARLCASRR